MSHLPFVMLCMASLLPTFLRSLALPFPPLAQFLLETCRQKPSLSANSKASPPTARWVLFPSCTHHVSPPDCLPPPFRQPRIFRHAVASPHQVSRQRAMLEDALLADGVAYDNLSFKVSLAPDAPCLPLYTHLSSKPSNLPCTGRCSNSTPRKHSLGCGKTRSSSRWTYRACRLKKPGRMTHYTQNT